MRIVGGRLKGRSLASPSSRDIRPTADRLRESLFNILIHAYDDPIAEARRQWDDRWDTDATPSMAAVSSKNAPSTIHSPRYTVGPT